MAEKILDLNIKLEKGYLYFCKPDQNGNLALYRTKMGRHKK
jgi:hypothetical protein